MPETKLHILVVEDSEPDFRLVVEYLKESPAPSFEITRAKDLRGALKAIAENKFDAILTDLGLPDSRGLPTLENISKFAPHLPIVVLTGHNDQDTGVAALQRKAQDYLVKGCINGDLLSRSIRHAIERKRAEEALKTSELRYRRLFESAKDGILILDFDTGLIVDVNPFLIDLIGYSYEDFLKKYIWDIGIFKDIVASKSAFLTLQEKAYIRYEDLPLSMNGGKKIDVEFVSNVYLVNGKKVIQCNIHDISERKRAEEKIRHMASFPGLNPNPIIELDVNARVTFSNLAAINVLERLKVAKKIKLFLPSDFAEILKHLKAGKKKDFTREIQIKGAFFIETLTVIPELKVVRIYARDITGLKNTERSLDDARRHLEAKVAERTEDLTQSNRQLIREISERKEAERNLSIRAAILKTMGRASTRKEFLDTIVKFIKGLTGCKYVGIRVLNEEKEIPYESYIGFSREFWEKENWLCVNYDQCICIRAITGKASLQDKPFMTRGGSFHAGNAIKFMDSLSKEEREQYRGVCFENGFASVSVVPVYYKGEIIAAIHLADERKDKFSSDTIRFIEKLTSLIGEGIHKFENEDNIRQGLMSQRALSEIIRYSFQETTLEHILNRALELILSLEWLALEPRASIYLASGEPDILILKAHKNLHEYLEKQCARVTLGECLCGKAASEGKVQFSTNIDKSHEIICKEMMPYGHYCVPILFGKKALGVINLYIPAGSRQDPRKEEFFLTFSNTLAEIIQRRQAEDELKKSSDRVISILESLSDGFFAGDKEWRLTYVNSAAERILEKKRSELIGRVSWDIFPKEKETKIFNELKTVMLKGVPESFEHLSPTLNKWVEVRAYPSEEGISVYFRDISEKKSSEEKLKDAQRQLEHAKRLSDIGTLAATVAHELRNPLAAIRMASFNIKRKAGNPLLDKHLSNIEKKISESDQIINNLLFYSRLRQPHYEKADLYKILEECLEIAKKRALKNSVEVKKKYRALRRVWVEADPLQMKELFSNILNNAYDAMHGNPGTIEISATHTNGAVVTIDIKDSGVGMDEEHMKRVHEPFFTTKAKGTGLGLTVAFQIAHLHNGSIELASKKGAGTTVTVTLPIKNTS